MNPNFEECEEWLRKARNDLVSARILLNHGNPVTDTACFHCQQAVPIIALSKISRLNILEELFSIIHIPEAVYKEVALDQKRRSDVREIKQQWIQEPNP